MGPGSNSGAGSASPPTNVFVAPIFGLGQKFVPKQVLGGPENALPPLSKGPGVVNLEVAGKKIVITHLGSKVIIAAGLTAYTFPAATGRVAGIIFTKLVLPLTLVEAGITILVNVGVLQATGHSVSDYVLFAFSPIIRIENVIGDVEVNGLGVQPIMHSSLGADPA